MDKLRILALSNFYPPHYIGGYELGCRDVVEALRRRGHEVGVLTSTYGLRRPAQDGQVYRWLRSDLGIRASSPARYWLTLFRNELCARRAFTRLVARLRPEVVYVWNARFISLAPALMAQRMGIPVCYYISDEWLAQWEAIDRWRRTPGRAAPYAIKRLLDGLLERIGGRTCPCGLNLDHVQCTSRHLKEAAMAAGKPVAHAPVVHWGIDLDRFPFRVGTSGPPARLLYVGQLTAKKGVHTAIEALRLLAEQGHRQLTLTIAGGTVTPEYEAQLRALVLAYGLEPQVRFTGMLPRERLPTLYREHDILVFPSVWDEPFSITLLEAMASGLAVVGTTTGGSAEILRHGANALVFPKEDAAACAAQIAALLGDPAQFERIRVGGRRTVAERFTIGAMVERVEGLLGEAVGWGA